ncbi:MAG: Uma2 family endonuclease [Dehalococcoidia bacterium]|nr:Uma2 family endonuclease [Dehalococcoidia bacterium]
MSAQPTSSAGVLHVSEEEYLRHYTAMRPSYEYVNGEVTQKPMTLRTLMLLAGTINAALYKYEQLVGGLGGEDPTVNLSRHGDRRYRAPDVAYWRADRNTGGEILAPPTLAVEIQSPGQTLVFLRGKCREYRERGVDVAWLVLPSRRVVEVFEAGRDGVALSGEDVLTSPHLPGFELRVAELFAVLGG